MATCPSCSATVEELADTCSECGVTLTALAVGADTASGAPTVPVGELGDDAPTRRAPSMIGRELIGQYVIRAKLGEGGMGEVYLADQPAIGREVAIKVVHAQTRGRELDDHVERFRNEAKAAASLESPHIVKIFNWGELEDGTSFMAMELLSGRTLSQVIREQGPLDAELAVSIACQVCVALGEAHAAGIVHRDLKPSNIMLIERGDEPNFAKVLDFGVAKLEGEDITRSGAMFGTPQYMSPEQLRAETLDGRSDLYSLGVVLYEMLAAELPFSSPTAVGFITAHLHDPPPPLPASVPSALAEVVMLLLAKDANQRPVDAAAVAAELQAALAGGSPAARRRARRRALRGVSFATLLLLGLGAIGYGGWTLWRWRTELDDQHARELELERAHNRELEQRVHEQEAAVARIRDEAQAMAASQMQTGAKVREQQQQAREQSREGNAQTRRTKLDPKTREMLTRTRAQLESELREVLDQRRVPPSVVAAVWRDHEARVAALDAGELDEDTLREDLASTISLYRKNFERKAAGDKAPLPELEQLFMTMATKTVLDEAERRARLDAIHEIYDTQRLPEVDRTYFKRLAVAKLIREHVAADAPAAVPEPPPNTQAKPVVPDELPPAEDDPPAPDQADGVLPSL